MKRIIWRVIRMVMKKSNKKLSVSALARIGKNSNQ